MKARVRLAYDGSGYGGWQKQTNTVGIQNIVEEALSRIHKEPSSVTASGRTDAGVHALGQVMHFDAKPGIHAFGYYQALNTLLPEDIRVLSVELVEDSFHARFSALKKVYEYVVTFDLDDPFNHTRKTRRRRPLDLEKMRQGAKVFLGTHDFTSFAHGRIEPNKPRTKTIEKIEITQRGKDIVFHYEADGFLRYQVRMMTGTLLALGEGRIAAEDISRMLAAQDKEACKFNAPAQGLYLMNVEYDPRIDVVERFPEEHGM